MFGIVQGQPNGYVPDFFEKPPSVHRKGINQEPKKGKLDLAGGFTDPNESAENTCKRELFEELRLHIDISNLRYLTSLPNVYQYKEIDYNTLDLFFEYNVNEKFKVDLEVSEISETIWIPLDQINLEDLAFDSQKKFLESYIENQK